KIPCSRSMSLPSELQSCTHASPFIVLTLRTHPPPTLFPYTTLFRSAARPVGHCARNRGERVVVARQRRMIFGGFASHDPKEDHPDRKSTRLNSSHQIISYAVFCLKKKKTQTY